MSAAVAEPPVLSPDAFVLSLPPERRHAYLLAFLRNARTLTGADGLVPIADEAGQPFGYFAPTALDEFERLNGPGFSEEYEREVDARFAALRERPGEQGLMSAEEFIAQLRREAAELQRQRS